MDGEKCWAYHMFRQVKGVKPSSVQVAHVNENPHGMDLLDVQPNRKPSGNTTGMYLINFGVPPPKRGIDCDDASFQAGSPYSKVLGKGMVAEFNSGMVNPVG